MKLEFFKRPPADTAVIIREVAARRGLFGRDGGERFLGFVDTRSVVRAPGVRRTISPELC